MPEIQLTDFLLLPKLKLDRLEHRSSLFRVEFYCSTSSEVAFCPHAPHANKDKHLVITKKRFRCEGMGCESREQTSSRV
jgi:hypothetical protein